MCRVEAALRLSHLAQDVVERFAGDSGVVGIAGDLERFEIGRDEQGVVVEHLFKVRDQPAFIGRVPCEAAAEMIVDAAVGHFVESQQSDIQNLIRLESS